VCFCVCCVSLLCVCKYVCVSVMCVVCVCVACKPSLAASGITCCKGLNRSSRQSGSDDRSLEVLLWVKGGG
jgi:hypothetical protein